MIRPHACPGGCGRQVPYAKLACAEDWARLPQVYKSEITAAYRRRAEYPLRHIQAVQAAVRWFQDNGGGTPAHVPPPADTPVRIGLGWASRASLGPLGLCGDRAEHAPHLHDSPSLGRFWCTADQSQREPYRSERRRTQRLVDES